MCPSSIISLLSAALDERMDLLDPHHWSAIRLFNGFLEGDPDLGVDLYADTLVFHNNADPPQEAEGKVQEARNYFLNHLPWVKTIIVKARYANTPEARRGIIVHGETAARRVREGNAWYALDLQLNQDTSFYLDTRNLRIWAAGHLSGKQVLNAFAYTGSLGVAAMAGGASRVLHIDRNKAFLNVAKTSYTLNGFPIHKSDFYVGDFFSTVGTLNRSKALFDCVFLDPPFFSVTGKGTVDLLSENARLINKVRPLIADNGWLAAVNNALFLSGADYLRSLEALCADGYLSIEELIPVPPDCTGYPKTRLRSLPADPAPFNHATKIAVLRVKRKAG